METLILGHVQVHHLLPVEECIPVMEEALKTLASGDVVLPLRHAVMLPDRRGLLGLMPAYLGRPTAMGAKIISVFHGNRGTPYESHQGAVLLFEIEHGRLLAMVDAASVTAIRTAAVSAVATRHLAVEKAGDLAILGSGTQASMHLNAMRAVRPIRRVRVWSRTPGHAEHFAARESERSGIRVEVAESAGDAVEAADVICTTTGAMAPILLGDWIAPGAHINAVGASRPPFRELDTPAVVRSRLYVDRRESAFSEAEDFLAPKREGAIGDEHIVGELGEVLLRKVPGRTSPSDITLFKSLGLAIEDLAAAHYVYSRALSLHAGTAVDFVAGRAE
jgi:ornithine cyclodeaminase